MEKVCRNCQFWVHALEKRERVVGTCRIRSTDGPFPPRYDDDWCGEYVALELKTPTEKTEKAEKPKKRTDKIVITDPVVVTEQTNGN